MKLSNRLLYKSFFIFGLFLSLIIVILYSGAYFYIQRSIYRDLENYGIQAIDQMLEKKNKQDSNQINYELLIKDESGNILIGNDSINQLIKTKMTDKLQSGEVIKTKFSTYYYLGFVHEHDNQFYQILIGHSFPIAQSFLNRISLFFLLIWVAGMLILFFLLPYLSRFAYSPIQKIISRTQAIKSDDEYLTKLKKSDYEELNALSQTIDAISHQKQDHHAIHRNFVNFVSNELKNPLAILKGKLEIFNRKEHDKDEYKRVIKETLKNVYKIDEILETLMIVSGIDRKQSPVHDVQIDQILWEMVDYLNGKYPHSKINVQIELAAEDKSMLQVKCPKPQLEMALFNICENAIKYSKGSKVEVYVKAVNDRLQLEIKDYGRGIPAKDLAHITKPFYKASNTNIKEGSGVGLALSSIICMQNNIDLSINSEEHFGTSVLLLFPSYS